MPCMETANVRIQLNIYIFFVHNHCYIGNDLCDAHDCSARSKPQTAPSYAYGILRLQFPASAIVSWHDYPGYTDTILPIFCVPAYCRYNSLYPSVLSVVQVSPVLSAKEYCCCKAQQDCLQYHHRPRTYTWHL